MIAFNRLIQHSFYLYRMSCNLFLVNFTMSQIYLRKIQSISHRIAEGLMTKRALTDWTSFSSCFD